MPADPRGDAKAVAPTHSDTGCIFEPLAFLVRRGRMGGYQGVVLGLL